ncbi:endospore germination permease [Cohnella faecalis]|uniref:Spore gernimation protein n=1 Tax=Cohnella faecalis TaxID=2315694 RepID=A0A398CN25_9BACL|nr:endospore germination permease [Cohnella faecalis]RIE02649.1 spore gernimation protein [Cohnella faecalis]
MKQDNGAISAMQMAFMMYPTVLASGFLALPTITAQYAFNDLWLTPIFASFAGFLTLFIALRLHKLYPGQTVIEYSVKIVGNIPGKLIGIVFFVYFIHETGVILRQYGDFVVGNFLFKTPILIVMSSTMLLSAIAVRGGAELLARSAMIFTPLFICPMLFLLMLIPDLDVQHLFPILERGLVPVLKGTLTPQAWACEYFIVTFFLPCLSNPYNGGKWGALSLTAVMISMLYVDFLVLFLLGPDTGNKVYPILTAFRYISLADFFENMEALLLAMWVVGNFIKIGVFFYASVISFTQCLNLSGYRFVVYPLAVWVVIFSIWDIPSFPHLAYYLEKLAEFEIPAVLTALPLVLLIVAAIRHKFQQSA